MLYAVGKMECKRPGFKSLVYSGSCTMLYQKLNKTKSIDHLLFFLPFVLTQLSCDFFIPSLMVSCFSLTGRGLKLSVEGKWRFQGLQ